MIDPLTEDLVLPESATGLFPRQPNGKKIHVSAIYRYMKHGCRGVILESIRTPRLATSRQAVSRFCRRLSGVSRPAETAIHHDADRRRAKDEVERELDHLGI